MQISSTELKGHAALFLVSLFYGLNYFVLKIIFSSGIDPFALLAIRCFATTLFFLVFHFLFIREKIRERKDYLRLLICALFGITLNQTFYIWGMSKTSEVNGAVLMIPTPVFVFLSAVIFREEKISLRKISGLLISISGAVGLLLTNFQNTDSSKGDFTGDLMIIFNAASYGLYLVLVRPLVMKYNPFTIITWIFIFGSVPNILIGIGPLLHENNVSMNAPAVWGMLYLILFATIGAYFLNAWAMKRMHSSAVGIYIYVQPVIVTIVSAILGIGGLTFLKLVFMLVIFSGVYFVTTRGATETQK